MASIKTTFLSGLVLGLSLLISGCQVAPGNTVRLEDNGNPLPSETTQSSPAVSKPVAKDGSKQLSEFIAPEILITDEYWTAMGEDGVVARDAINLGLSAIKVFTLDFAKYQKSSEALDQEKLLALLPEAEASFKPLMNEGTLQSFSEKWKTDAADPADLKSSSLMLMLKDSDTEKTEWDNEAGLKCETADAEWSTTFSEPQLTAVPEPGRDYSITHFQIKAHYLIPCADGKVLGQVMDWDLSIAPDATNTKWQVYKWERKPIGEIAYVQ